MRLFSLFRKNLLVQFWLDLKPLTAGFDVVEVNVQRWLRCMKGNGFVSNVYVAWYLWFYMVESEAGTENLLPSQGGVKCLVKRQATPQDRCERIVPMKD